MIRAGALRTRIEVWEDLAVQGGATDLGELPVNYQPVATRWGCIEGLAGRELERARQVVATATHKIILRWVKGLNPRHQLRWGSTVYEIGHIISPQPVDIEMQVYVTERPGVMTNVTE